MTTKQKVIGNYVRKWSEICEEEVMQCMEYWAEIKSKEVAVGFQRYLTGNYTWVSEQGFWYKKEKAHEGTVPENASEIYPLYLEHLKQQNNV